MQSQRKARKAHEGIEVRHTRSCLSRSEGECDCKPSFQAFAWAAREGKRIHRTFATLTEAKACAAMLNQHSPAPS
jgi:hypothetical protein